jgi:hypothetical protein
MSSDEYNTYAINLNDSEYEILRHQPKITKLVQGMHGRYLNLEEFPFIDTPPDYIKKGKKKGKKKSKSTGGNLNDDNAIDNPRIMIFIIGGISHHELVSI